MSNERAKAVSEELAAARDDVLRVVSGLTDEQFGLPTVNEGWSVQDTLSHLATIHARNRNMWTLTLEGKPWPADGEKIDAYSDRLVKERRAWPCQKVVEEFRESASESVRFLERLSSDELDKPWQHPSAGLSNIETMARVVPKHLRQHAAEIEAAVK